jgi:hypothetical protein
MKRFLCSLACVLALSGGARRANAQYYNGPPPAYSTPQPYPNYYGGYPPGPRLAPDMCGGYFYCTDGCTWYGPSYCVRPPFEPFNGIIPGKQGPGMAPPNNMPPPPTPAQFAAQKYGPAGMGQAQAALPYNPWTRSPRDYFMWSNAQQELHTREARPRFVP